MAQCTKCGAYTKFEGGLCTKCYHEKNDSKGSVDKHVDIDESNGLTDKEHNYTYNCSSPL